MSAVRIIPAAPLDGGVTPTRGTAVRVGEHELRCTRIELVAQVNDVWRCTLDVVGVIPPELVAELDRVRMRPTWRDVRNLIAEWWKS